MRAAASARICVERDCIAMLSSVPVIRTSSGRPRAVGSVRTFDGPREGDARWNIHLVKDVTKVGFDGLLAEEEFGSDLCVRLAVDDQSRHLQLARGEGRDTSRVGPARPCAPGDAMAKLPQLAFGFVAVTQSAAGVEVVSGMLKFGDRTPELAGPGECAAGHDPRDRRLDGGAYVIGGRR